MAAMTLFHAEMCCSLVNAHTASSQHQPVPDLQYIHTCSFYYWQVTKTAFLNINIQVSKVPFLMSNKRCSLSLSD